MDQVQTGGRLDSAVRVEHQSITEVQAQEEWNTEPGGAERSGAPHLP